MLCGERLGSQQMLLMDSVLGCHPLPLELGTLAATGYPAMPVFSPAGGSLSWFTNGTPSQHREQQRKAPDRAIHFFLPGTTPASLRAQCRRVQLRLQAKAVGCPDSLGHQFIREMMQRIFMPEGRRQACGSDGELCGHRVKQDGAQ